MRRVITLTSIGMLATLPIIGSGCVPQDKYDHLLMAKRTVEEQAYRAEADRDEARANLEAALAELQNMRGSYENLDEKYGSLTGQVDNLAAANDDYLRRIAEMSMGPLPADVESALTQLSAAYPELLTFDAKKGMVRFASDFTFGLGSADLTDDASLTLDALAGILNSETAASFEVRVVGHTDDVPIRRAETLRRHRTNVHLSVHRAIAVRDRLVSAGVEPMRLEVAGAGPYRPIVANKLGGSAENRRVEVFLVPLRSLLELPEAPPMPVSATQEPTMPTGIDPEK